MSDLLNRAISAIDAANSGDPNRIMVNGQSEAKELVYAKRMTAWLFRLEEHPSEILQIAARAQHICRWEIARTSYPPGRIAYLQWRTSLYAYHAERAGKIMREVGYDAATLERVQKLLRKQGIKTDPDMQTLEDVICLVFLEYELADFAARHPVEKVVEILQKTWKKMSARGHSAAVELLPSLPEKTQQCVQLALK